MARILILATGGTIAGAALSPPQAGYTSGQVDVHQMIQAVPDLEKRARVEGEQFSNVGSQDISFERMTRLALRINTLLAQKEIQAL